MDETLSESLRQLIHRWVSERHQALLEQVSTTWREGIDHLVPDESLLGKIQECLVPGNPPRGLPADTESDLGAALDLIESSSSQGEVLKRLLEGLQPFAERSALFVIKQGIATLFAARGFEPEAPRPGTPVVPPAELEDLVQCRTSSIAAPGPAYLALLASLGRFEAPDVRILPLRLRRRTVALLLVDCGLRQVIDHPSHVRALAHAAEATLSFLAGLKDEDKTSVPIEAHPSMPPQRVPEPVPEPEAPPLDPRIRANAERSARVLVGDIELYFPGKVAQGKEKGNLYMFLREELDRSLASFTERYGPEVENRFHIFYKTVVHQLCDGDADKLGQPPWVPTVGSQGA